MKRYLTVGTIFGILVIAVVIISWLAFPAWKDTTSGFWILLGVAIVGVGALIKDTVSVWKDLKEEKENTEQQPPHISQTYQNVESIYNIYDGDISSAKKQTIGIKNLPISVREIGHANFHFHGIDNRESIGPGVTQGISLGEDATTIKWSNRNKKSVAFFLERFGNKNYQETEDEFLIWCQQKKLLNSNRVFFTKTGALLFGPQDLLPFQTDVLLSEHVGGVTLRRFEGLNLMELVSRVLKDLEFLWRNIKEYPNIRDDNGNPFIYRKYPRTAIQEALVNFIIHRDYNAQEAHIDIHESHVVFTNPGACPYDPDVFLEEDLNKPPYPRNEVIIQIFSRTKLSQRQRRGLWHIKQSLIQNGNIDNEQKPLLWITNDKENNQFIVKIGAATLPTEIQQDVHSINYDNNNVDITNETTVTGNLHDTTSTIRIVNAPDNFEASSARHWLLKHHYTMTGFFTGRETELKTLTDWLEEKDEPLFILRALGGFGKSALTWHWLLNKVDRTKWTKAVWWSFYEGGANFINFLEDTLKYLLGEDVEFPSAPRLQVEMLLKALEKGNILLVLDGFELALRAYSSMSAAYQEDGEDKKYDERDLDCVSPAADDFLRGLASSKGIIQAKVLMTTRLRPRAVEMRGNLLNGCLEKELAELSKEDAVAFFQNQGIKGTRAEIEAACEPYGYHPLTLNILAGYILDNRSNPNDVSVARELNITEDIIQNKHHVLEVAYNSLSPEKQKLLSKIACFRSPTSYETLKFITESPLTEGVPFGDDKGKGEGENLDDQLKQLETRGLLHWDKDENKYDLHPIVRRYAYERLTAPDRTTAHTRLRNYFEAVPKPEKIEYLNDLAPAIELYHHMVRAEQFDKAWMLFNQNLSMPLYYQFGEYQQIIELLPALLPEKRSEPVKLKNESAQARAINMLANAYALKGEPRKAVPYFKMQNSLQEKQGDKGNLSVGLTNIATQQLVIGALGETERNLRNSIKINRETKNNFGEAIGLQELGRVLSYRGLWKEATQTLDGSLKLFERNHQMQSLSVVLAYHSFNTILIARENSKEKNKSLQLAIEQAQHALELVEVDARTSYPVERDFVRVHWLLGAAYRAYDNLEEAENYLGESLRRCRMINSVDVEADILLENSKLRHAQGSPEEALRLAQEALTITERSGYVLQGADVNLWLAELALEGLRLHPSTSSGQGDEGLSDRELAREYAETALKLAHCDDGPPYHYKVAYEEAQRLLAKLEKQKL